MLQIYRYQFHKGLSQHPPAEGFFKNSRNLRFDRENFLISRDDIVPAFSTAPAPGNAVKAFFQMNLIYYAVAGGSLYRSTDSGDTWSNVGSVHNTTHSDYMFTQFGDAVLLVDGSSTIKYYDGSYGTISVPDSKPVNKIVRHQNRIYVAYSGAEYVYYSTANDYKDFVTDGGVFNANLQGQNIKTICEWRNRLIIFAGETLELIGDPSANPTLLVVLDMGTDQEMSLVKTCDSLYFHNNRGIIEWSGQGTYSVVSSELQGLEFGDCWGGYDDKRDQVLFSTSEGNVIYIYDRTSGIWLRDQGAGATQIKFAPPRETENELILLSDNEIPNKFDHNVIGSGETYLLETKRSDFGVPGVLKRIRSVTVDGVFDADATVEIKYTNKENSVSDWLNMNTLTLGNSQRSALTYCNLQDLIGIEFAIRITCEDTTLIRSILVQWEWVRGYHDLLPA